MQQKQRPQQEASETFDVARSLVPVLEVIFGKQSSLDQSTTCPAAVNSGLIDGVVVEQIPPTAAVEGAGAINEQHVTSGETNPLCFNKLAGSRCCNSNFVI